MKKFLLISSLKRLLIDTKGIRLVHRLIGGYFFHSLNHFDLCYVVENVDEEISGFLLTINESEKYDKFIQSTWITQLQQKYPNVDRVTFLFLFIILLKKKRIYISFEECF